MKTRIIIGVALLLGVAGAVRAQQDSDSARAERAGRALEKWLDEDVAYIITDTEKRAFKALTTDEERLSFIETFWLRRDPTPDTPENEYRIEHYERIAYANEHFTSGFPGWMTDRGRIYILYGPPDSKPENMPMGGSYDRPFWEGGGRTTVYPFEQWRYRYIEGFGNEVIFEFVDPSGTGEYRLAMSPHEKDALANVAGVGFTDWELMSPDPEQARLYRGTALERRAFGTRSPFDRLEQYARAFVAPEVKFTDLETIVTTNLSFNQLPFSYRVDTVPVGENADVLTLVTIQLRNSDIAFQETDGIYQGVLNVYGRVTGINGRIAETFDENVQIALTERDYRATLDGYHVHQAIVPLSAARYKLDLVVKDINSGDVGTVTQSFTVPRFAGDRLATSSLILADLIQPLPPRDVGSGPFKLGDLKVRPSVAREFRRNRELGVWLQLYNLQVDETTLRPSATIETLITRDGQEVDRLVESTDEDSERSGGGRLLTLSKIIKLLSYEPGEYAIQVRVTDHLADDIVSVSDRFEVLPALEPVEVSSR